MPSSPNTTVDYLDDLNYFKDFENEFPAIVYNDGLTSKSDLEINPLVSSERIDKFNLIDEASLFEYDEKIVSRFNDLFNIIHPDDSKSEKNNGNNDIGSFVIEVNIVIWEYYVNGMLFFLIINLYVPFGIPFDPKRYYKEGSHTNIAEAKIWYHYQLLIRDAHGLDTRFRSTLRSNPQDEAGSGCEIEDGVFWMSDTEMGLDVADTLCFQLGGVRRRITQRQFILALGLHTEQEMGEAGFGAYWDGSDKLIPDKGDLRDYWIEISSDRDFLGPTPSYVLIRDPVRRLCHKMISYSISGRGQAPEKVTSVDLFYLRSMDRGTTNVPYLLAQYLFRHAEGRKSRAKLLGGYFIGCLAMHFGLVSDEGLRGLQGPERQQAAAAGAHMADEAGPTAEEDRQSQEGGSRLTA
ncbi:hypothetical protein Tco_1456498 [Tanacetum coccineum]